MLLAPHARGVVASDPIFQVAGRAQAARAAGRDVVDASIGVMLRDDGRLWVMPTPACILQELPSEALCGYTPFLGTPGFREAVCRKLPAPEGWHTTFVATPGATGAIFLLARTFLSPGQALLAHQPCWSNYGTIARWHGLEAAWYPYVDERDRFHVDAMASAASALLERQGRVMVVLNAPAHNPTGYSLDAAEWRAVAAAMGELCRSGRPVALVVDAAYQEFTPDPEADRRFADHFAHLPENFLLAAGWSGSKSFTWYGLRLGALVAMSRQAETLRDLEGAAAMLARGTWSNAPRPGMVMVEQVVKDPATWDRVRAERAEMRAVLAERARIFREAADLPTFPYHAGFFTVVRNPDPPGAAAALEDRGVFAVPMAGGIRVALSGVATANVARVARALAEVTPGRSA